MTTKLETLTLSEIIARFLARHDLSVKGKAYYGNILTNLEWYSQKHEWPKLEELNRSHIRDFIGYVATEDNRWPQGKRGSYKAATPATVYHYTKAVKTLFNWAEYEEYILMSPVSRLKVRPPRYKEVEPYTDDEVRNFLNVLEDDIKYGFRAVGIRNKAILSMFISTGLRLEELSNISLNAIDHRLQQITVLGKGHKMRSVPLNGEAKKALRQYLDIRPAMGEMLWVTDDGEPMTMFGVRTMLFRLKKRAGVTSPGGAHRFRHYFATRYLDAGGDLNSLRLLLGHSTLAMVLRYSKQVSASRAISQHYQFDPLDRLVKGDWKGKEDRPGREKKPARVGKPVRREPKIRRWGY